MQQEKDIDKMVKHIVEDLVNTIQESGLKLSKDQLLAVRSSSTLEDLENMAGAGLYDSILNVRLADYQHPKDSIIDVWLSLYTKRATISRR